jgi:Putative transposase
LRLGGTDEDAEATILGKRCAKVAGFNVHANARAGANDRVGLEHLCRYLARPPIANDRLQELPRVVTKWVPESGPWMVCAHDGDYDKNALVFPWV